MGQFKQAVFVQALKDAGFKVDRSLYQYDALFLTKKFGRVAVIISVYPGHFTATKCWMRSPAEGYKVDDYVQGTTSDELLAKATEWDLVL